MDYIDYIPAAIPGIVALLILVLTLYYRNRNLTFQVSRDKILYKIDGKSLVYLTCLFLLLSAGILALRIFQPRYNEMLQTVDSIISVLFLGIIIALIAGVQNLYALIALGGIILAIIGCMFWFTQVFNPNYKLTGVLPLGLAFILSCIYLIIIYFSWTDNRSRYGHNWTSTTIIIAFISLLALLTLPILKFMNIRNPILDNYLPLILNVGSKVVFSGLLTYGVLSHSQL